MSGDIAIYIAAGFYSAFDESVYIGSMLFVLLELDGKTVASPTAKTFLDRLYAMYRTLQ